jgi:hypothetical protein
MGYLAASMGASQHYHIRAGMEGLYCTKKYLPMNWGGSEANCEVNDAGVEGLGLVKVDVSTTIERKGDEEVTAEMNGGNVESESEDDAEPAVCYGHLLERRGAVKMKLHWKDDDSYSVHEVYGVMNNKYERRAFGATWIDYCDSNALLDDTFRMMGRSIVKSIEGHDWGDCGRSRARIAWRHGEVTTELVKDARELLTDKNGFKVAWEEYCAKIGNTTEEFMKGYVDKEHKMPSQKKARYSK